MNDFLTLCRQVGAKTPEWVQGAGGNISQKLMVNGRALLRIKASGYRLGEVSQDRGYVDLDLAAMGSALVTLPSGREGEERYAQLLAQHLVARQVMGDRASMETSFHVMLDAPWVVHFHSIAAILLADRYYKADTAICQFVEACFDLKLVDFVKPGLDLAFALQNAGAARFYILRNHGVILALSSPSELDDWIKLEERIKKLFGWVNVGHRESCGHDSLPFRVYLPDTAVFLKKLLPALTADPDRPDAFRLRSDDPNLVELWQATGLMHQVCPDLTEIPKHIWSEIAGLPTEQFRLLRHEEHG